MAIYQFEEHAPQLGAGTWIADDARVIGRVTLGAGTSVWHGALLRGDNDAIRIGERCNIQDGAVLHTDAGFELVLGHEVSVGHQAMLHGCTVGDGSLIGIRSVVLNGARIGRQCVVGAGAVVTEGKTFPDLALIVGAPARVLRQFTPEAFARFARIAPRYVELARRHRDGVRRIG